MPRSKKEDAMAFSLEVPDENEVKAIVKQQVEPTEERRQTH